MSAKKWRAKHIQIPLTPSKRAIITLRRFRTNKANRAKHIRQLVIRIRLRSVREIAFKLTRKPTRRGKNFNDVPWAQWREATSSVLLVIGLAGSIAFSVQAVKVQALEPPTPVQPAVQVTEPLPEPEPPKPFSLPRSKPTDISIPNQDITAPLIAVGQASDGTIKTPSPFNWEAGWYNKSPTPGEIGPSIIVGHVDNYEGISVFWRLRYIETGDTVRISRADGTVAKFIVDRVQQFDQNNFPTELIYGNTDTAQLRLITCAGTFNETTQRYSENTVVFAHLVK